MKASMVQHEALKLPNSSKPIISPRAGLRKQHVDVGSFWLSGVRSSEYALIKTSEDSFNYTISGNRQAFKMPIVIIVVSFKIKCALLKGLPLQARMHPGGVCAPLFPHS